MRAKDFTRMTVRALVLVLTLILIQVLGISWRSLASPPAAKRVILGGMQCISITNNPDAATIVYLHGWGGTATDVYDDLFTQTDEPGKVRDQFNWIIPTSPKKRTWFNIEKPDKKAWEEQLAIVRKSLDQLVKESAIQTKELIFAGFSQGAVVAVDYVLHTQQRYKGLIVNSGVYFDSPAWQRKAPHLKHLPFAMTHDPEDGTIPFSEARKLKTLLLDNGLTGSLRSTTDQHRLTLSNVESSIQDLTLRPGSAK
jgi:predicted esterase